MSAVDAFGITDVGRVRDKNEDHFVVASMRKSVTIRFSSLGPEEMTKRLGGAEAFLFAVADGVGGRPGGEIASSAVVTGLLGYVGRAAGCYHQFNVDEEHQFLERLERSIRDAHEEIIRAHGDSAKAPATTLTLAMLVGVRAYIVHVGDTRAYYLRQGRLRQLTRDQTIGEFMMDQGAWTATQAAKSAAGKALASAIGGSELTPSVGLIDLEPGDTLLLCSDGLNKHVLDQTMTTVLLQPTSAEAAARELVDLALAGGGTDNVTAIVARIL